MAIGSLSIDWLSSLALRSEIPAGAAVLDLGTQDICTTPEALQLVAARHLAPADRDRVTAAIFEGGTPRPRSQRDFYSIFGAGSYRSIDLSDPRADFALDLNLPVPAETGVYDMVTNFGTTEHVFNISQTFASIHNLLKAGGIQLHALPAYAAIDHGFYNIHPCLYLDIARANAYDIVDLHYIDNIDVRMARPVQAQPFDFGSLPIQRRDMRDTYAFMTKVALQFHRNLRSEETRAALEKLAPELRLDSVVMPDERLPIYHVFDMVFAALRKTSRSPEAFVTPQQGVYANPPSKIAGFLRRLLRRI